MYARDRIDADDPLCIRWIALSSVALARATAGVTAVAICSAAIGDPCELGVFRDRSSASVFSKNSVPPRSLAESRRGVGVFLGDAAGFIPGR